MKRSNINSQNAGNFSELANDTLIEEIVEKNLSFADISNLRQTCGFFANQAQLTEIWKKQQVKVVASNRKTFIVHNGHVFAMGDNKFNGLGLEQKKFYYRPELVILPNNMPAVNVIASPRKTFLVDSKGTDYQCGGDYGDIDTALIPIQLPNDESIIEVIPGNHQFFIRTKLNNWYGCGSNIHGQLGLANHYKHVQQPTLISLPNGLPIDKIVTGWACTYLRDSKGQWHVCGSGYGPGLDHFKDTFTPVPAFLPNNQPIIDIKLCFESFFICDNKGQWHACGTNRYAELGLGAAAGTYVLIPQPIYLPNNKRIIKIIPADNHSFFCDEDGQWHTCGYGCDGALGIGIFADKVYTPKPINLFNGRRIIDMIAGASHTFFRDERYRWYGSGSNEHGELSLSEEIKNRFNPTRINFSKLDAKIEAHKKISQDHVCPIKLG